jgi:membrane protease YdiL (CAAX protease family)
LLDVATFAAMIYLLVARAGAPPAAARPFAVSFTGMVLEDVPGGIRVVRVADGSTAARAGLKTGDVVWTVHGHAVGTASDLDNELLKSGPPLRTLGLYRSEKFLSASIEAQAPPLFEAHGRRAAPGPGLGSWAPAFLLLLVIALWAGRRGERWSPIWVIVIHVAALAGSAMGSWIAWHQQQGMSAGGWLVLQSMFTATLLLGGWLLYRREPSGIEQEAPPSVIGWGAFYGLAFSARLSVIGFALVGIARWQTPMSPLTAFRSISPSGIPVLLLAAVVLAPVGEELLYRGVLQPSLRRICGARLAIALTAALFALMHPHYGPLVVQTFGLGCVLGWARERTGALSAPILIHAAINGTAAIGALAARGFFG